MLLLTVTLLEVLLPEGASNTAITSAGVTCTQKNNRTTAAHPYKMLPCRNGSSEVLIVRAPSLVDLASGGGYEGLSQHQP